MLKLFAALLLSVILAAPQARAQSDGDAIASVIEDQLSAFMRRDLPGAFGHASPMIQGMFGTPERFGEMVREGYPMVWQPGRWEMRELTPTPGGFVQTVLFQDQRGRLYLADYEMMLIDGVWRINGVQLRALPGLGA